VNVLFIRLEDVWLVGCYSYPRISLRNARKDLKRVNFVLFGR
jgi:hypothetical protein